MSMRRAAVLGAGLRRLEDPEQSRDPQIQSVLANLRSLPLDVMAPAPREQFRAELRTQLVAVAPRIISESAAPETAAAAKPGRVAGARTETARRERPSLLGRRVGVAGAVLTACLLIFGGVLWQSQRALPGDALYGLKRASESIRLDFAGSDTARAKDYLGFAGTRVDEAQALVQRSLPSASGPLAGGRLSPATAALVRQTLGSANTDVRSASRLLTGEAVQGKSASPLAPLHSWAPQQQSRLRVLSGMLPAGRLRHFAIQSSGLVHRTDVRATDLSRTIRAGCSGARSHCRLGRSVAKEHGATSGRSSHSRATTGVGRTSHRAASRSARTGTAPSIPARRSGANHLPRPRLSLPHAPAPTHKASLPTKLPSLLPSSLPLNLRSCAIAVGTISLGNCPTS